MRGLALHRFFLRLALSGVSVFAWVFLFDYFYLLSQNLATALSQVALLYALASVVTCLTTPFAAQVLRAGTRRALIFALLFIASAFIVMGATLEGFWGPQHTSFAIILFAVLLGIYRALYWVPYELETTSAPVRKFFVGEIVLSLAPFCAGIFIAASATAPIWIFYIGAVLVGLSALPLLSMPDINETFSWSYRETFHELLSREHRSYVTHAILEGVSGGALLLFWPLAVFLLVAASYGMLGIILSLTLLAALFLRAPMRALLRRAGFQESRLLTTVLAATPWLFRLVIVSPLSVVLVDSYFYTTTPRRMGIDPFAFEQSSDGGSLIDEFTALKEMALSIGKITICVIGAAAAIAFSVPVAFFIVFCTAAIASTALALKR